MTIEECKNQLDAFLKALSEHYQLWSKSVNRISGRPWANVERLNEQSRSLSRQLGRIRPYILLFERNWMSSPTSNCTESPGEIAHLGIRRGA